MGFRGHVDKQEQARVLRAQAWTLADIAAEVGAAKSSVSVWVRDVEFVPRPRNRNARSQRPHPLKVAKEAEIERLVLEGRKQVGALDRRDLLVAGVALYAGEGSKRGTAVGFANSDPRMVRLFCCWLREFFEIDEERLRVRVYLHEGLDLDVAERHWSDVTGVPRTQFHRAYRAKADPTRRSAKHVMGCATVIYSCATTARAILGLCEGLLACEIAFRGGAIGSAADC